MRALSVRPRGLRDAMERALHNEDGEFAQTRWSDALSAAGRQEPWGGRRFGSRLVDSRTVQVKAPPRIAFTPIRRIGGATGWYFANLLWRLRGFLDLLAGGVGLRRGRRDPNTLGVGDTLDFWRVEAFDSDRLLRLAAEMKVPGRILAERLFTGGHTSPRSGICHLRPTVASFGLHSLEAMAVPASVASVDFCRYAARDCESEPQCELLQRSLSGGRHAASWRQTFFCGYSSSHRRLHFGLSPGRPVG